MRFSGLRFGHGIASQRLPSQRNFTPRIALLCALLLPLPLVVHDAQASDSLCNLLFDEALEHLHAGDLQDVERRLIVARDQECPQRSATDFDAAHSSRVDTFDFSSASCSATYQDAEAALQERDTERTERALTILDTLRCEWQEPADVDEVAATDSSETAEQFDTSSTAETVDPARSGDTMAQAVEPPPLEPTLDERHVSPYAQAPSSQRAAPAQRRPSEAVTTDADAGDEPEKDREAVGVEAAGVYVRNALFIGGNMQVRIPAAHRLVSTLAIGVYVGAVLGDDGDDRPVHLDNIDPVYIVVPILTGIRVFPFSRSTANGGLYLGTEFGMNVIRASEGALSNTSVVATMNLPTLGVEIPTPRGKHFGLNLGLSIFDLSNAGDSYGVRVGMESIF